MDPYYHAKAHSLRTLGQFSKSSKAWYFFKSARTPTTARSCNGINNMLLAYALQQFNSTFENEITKNGKMPVCPSKAHK